MKIKFLLAFLTIVLTACGSGGGGSSSSPDNSGNPSGGNGGGTTSGGDGNSAYYGFSTDSVTTISNQSTPPTGGTQMTIANEVSFNLRNLNTRILDVTIFKPTCILGLLTETYSLVLLDGSNSSPTVASAVVTANGITFQERGVLSGVSMYDYGSAISISGTCSNGLLDLGSSGKIFSNGKIILWKTGLGDLYVGGRSSMIETVMGNFQLRQFDKFEQIDNNSLNPSNALSTWISGDIGQLTTDASASSSNSSFANSSGNTNIKGFASNSPNARYAANSNGAVLPKN